MHPGALFRRVLSGAAQNAPHRRDLEGVGSLLPRIVEVLTRCARSAAATTARPWSTVSFALLDTCALILQTPCSLTSKSTQGAGGRVE